jgi:hypothetical protein
MHPKLLELENAIHAVLGPRGFQKQKLIWRRSFPSLIQIVGLEKRTTGPSYNLRYGLWLPKYFDSSRPTLSRLHVQWAFPEQLAKYVDDIQERRRVLEAFDLDSKIQSSERAAKLAEILVTVVLPVFDATVTVKKLRVALTDYSSPAYTVLIRFDSRALDTPRPK